METIAITATPKGHRIWIQGLQGKGITATHVTVVMGEDVIGLVFSPNGKRKVTQLKGGLVDLQSKAVTRWAAGATEAHITVTGDLIEIRRA